MAPLNLRYRYYEGGVSSVYFWNLDDGFAGVVLLKKGKDTSSGYYFKWVLLRKTIAVSPTGKSEGAWDSIHVFEAIDRARTAHYKLTSTVILHLSTNSESLGEMDLSGNMTRQVRASVLGHLLSQ
jgi:capping protein (actin filament) muscle Z-line, beta